MNAAAFQQEAMRLERLLYGIAWSMLGNNEDCADAVQETLTRAWQGRDRLRSASSFRPWLTKMMVNGGVEVFGDWVASLALVDGDGVLLFPDTNGCTGYGSEWAEFVYPFMAEVPEKMYLAPVVNGAANMAQAILVK